MTSQIKIKKEHSIAEYLEKELRQGERFEYYNGQITLMPGGIISHNRICRNLIVAIDNAIIEEGDLEIFGSDQKVFLPQYNFYLYPDAIVVTTEPITVENETDAIINPVLIIEVASPSTAKYDKGDKFVLYKSLPSFKEYVLVRQNQAEVNLFFREEEDLWRSTDVRGIENSVFFKSIGVSLSIERIYRKVIV